MITKRRYNPKEDIKTFNPNLRMEAIDLLERLFGLMSAIKLDQRVTTAYCFGLWTSTGIKRPFYEYETTILDQVSKADLNFDEKMVMFNFVKESCLVSDITETLTYQTYNRRKLNPQSPQNRKVAGVKRVDRFDAIPSPSYIVRGRVEAKGVTRYDFDIDKKVEEYILGVLNAG